ncbi:MAG TPA: carboxypeptidase regulatory-like domain-containing protein [Vicinamibacterales bacterium]|nr:carboxypeptidase regulatory-like domain-containing protein [Vicinamibacterales bacterium]
MVRRLAATIAFVFLMSAVGAVTAHGQGLTGQLSGTVTDAGGGVIPGATVMVTNAGTNQTRETITSAEGTFVFPDLLAGTYHLTIKMEGFKAYEQKDIALGATERVGLRTIALEVGGLQEQIVVKSEAALVQTTSAARSGLVTRDQIEDIAVKGRDFAAYLKLLPGVVDTSAREAPGWGSMGGLSINGRSGGFNFSYDGVTNKDTGSNSGNYQAPALDSIGEVRVQTSNFQAEYGRSSGATITVVTRAGTKDFHGSAAYYKRDTKLNANEFSRKQQCGLGQTAQCDPPLYKFDNTAWTIGGPVLLPGTDFNKSRNRLFFFWSQDLLGRTDPGGLNQRRVPTALERKGDFSQTFDSQGRLVSIRDPQLTGSCSSTSGGPACFPGNVIPGNRIDSVTQALLNLMPLPNATDPTGNNQYNYTFQTVQDWPRNDQVLRMDWNVGKNTTFYARGQYGYEKRAGGVSFLGSSGGWPQYPSKYEIDTRAIVGTLLHTFNTSTFAEVTAGINWSHQYTSAFDDAALAANDRTKVLPGLTQFFPQANPDNVLPQATFGGGLPTPNTGNPTYASFGVEQRWPFFGFNKLFNVSTNLTKIKGSHNMKAGFFLERTRRPAARSSSFNGTFSFNTDSSNPLNTNVGFANALLGAVTQYQESDAHPSAHGLFYNVEWYAQDNWKLRRNFTIDAGMRFYWIQPTKSAGDKVAEFIPSQYDASKAPLLYQPVTTSQGRRALNPLTNEILPLVYVGRLVPNSGNFINGMQVFDDTVLKTPPIKLAPRIGFAWDVTGDGHTAVRGGAGVFYDRFSDDNILDLIELPPLLNTYTTNYTTVRDLLASPLTATPTAVRYFPTFTPPVVYNWSLGVQRDVVWGLVADVAYVGNAARNQLITVDINGRPYGYTYQASSLDPTNISGGIVQPLPDDLLRPYRGYGRIQERDFSGYSDYHSMQVAMNRRRSADGLSFGVAYTYQIVNKGLGAIDPFVSDKRARNYNSNGRRPHTLTFNYSYDVPELSKHWNNIIAKAVFDNWQVSGVTSIISGAYGNFGYNFTNVPTGTLSGTGSINGGGSRVDIVCDPTLPKSQRTYSRQFKTECIAPPSDQFRLGNAKNDEFHGPGFMNWDISFFKNIPLGASRRQLQLRTELYNAFNSNQWTAVNTTATFDYQTGKQTNAAFGSLTGATNSARRIQLAARFTF